MDRFIVAKELIRIAKKLTAKDKTKEIVNEAKEISEKLKKLYGVISTSDEFNAGMVDLVLPEMQNNMKAVFKLLKHRW